MKNEKWFVGVCVFGDQILGARVSLSLVGRVRVSSLAHSRARITTRLSYNQLIIRVAPSSLVPWLPPPTRNPLV
jgi:hypothetical protein